MLAIVKLLQSLFKTLHSDGTPGQIAAGIALGSALGLTPIVNAHNLVIVLLLAILNVSFASGLLGWALFVPVGFMFDPLFHRIGRYLLVDVASLRPMWTAMENVPGLALTNFNNSVVLGSFVVWLVMFAPMYFFFHWAVIKYRVKIGDKIMGSRLFKAVQASKIYNVYTLFRP